MNEPFLISESEAKAIIMKSGGAIFATSFFKKDGSLREMNARLHVKKYLVHKDNPRPSTTAHIDKYITVFEMCGDAEPKYRNINIETMMTLTHDGKTYVVCHEATETK